MFNFLFFKRSTRPAVDKVETIAPDTFTRPDYWCPEHKGYCKGIIEVYDNVWEMRKWVGDNYELEDSDMDDVLVAIYCRECYEEKDMTVEVLDEPQTIDK